MDTRSLLVGLVVGGAVGAGAAWWRSAGEREVRHTPGETRHGADVTPRLAGVRPPEQSKASVTRSPLEQALASGDFTAINAALYVPRRTPPPSEAEIGAALTLLTRALEKKDPQPFRAAVAVLTAGSDDPRAREALVRLMADADVPSDLLRSPALANALGTTPDPAVAKAARARFERNLAAGETSWVAADTWLLLLARHGSPEEVAWIAERNESSQIRRKAIEALAASRNPAAVRHLRDALHAGRLDNALSAMLESSTEEGLRLLEERWQALHADPPAIGEPGTKEVAALWSQHAPREDAPRLVREMLRSADERRRIEAVYALTVLARRGIDVAEFEPLLLAPVVALERRATPREDGQHDAVGNTAVYAIEYNPITWSERAARALENAHAPGGSDPRKIAAKVRAGLADPWHR
jgi:hypothetical protein